MGYINVVNFFIDCQVCQALFRFRRACTTHFFADSPGRCFGKSIDRLEEIPSAELKRTIFTADASEPRDLALPMGIVYIFGFAANRCATRFHIPSRFPQSRHPSL